MQTCAAVKSPSKKITRKENSGKERVPGRKSSVEKAEQHKYAFCTKLGIQVSMRCNPKQAFYATRYLARSSALLAGVD